MKSESEVGKAAGSIVIPGGLKFQHPASSSRINYICNWITRFIYPIIGSLRMKDKEAPNQKDIITTMVSDIEIFGVKSPEKAAHGHCPYCGGLIALWITINGFELSTNEKKHSSTVR